MVNRAYSGDYLIQQLIQARRNQSISQEELAFNIGIETSTLHRWETLARTPSYHNLISWVDALELKLETKTKVKI